MYIADFECLLKHDRYGNLYNGLRAIASDGQQCIGYCRSIMGIGVACQTSLHNQTFSHCHIPSCRK